MKMLHTCLRVKDLGESLKFYEEVIGLKETRRIDRSEYGFIIVYLADGENKYELELTYNFEYPEGGYDLGNGFSHMAFGVENFEESHKKNIEAGYEVTDLKGLPGFPPTYYFVTDPDGYKVEIINLK